MKKRNLYWDIQFHLGSHVLTIAEASDLVKGLKLAMRNIALLQASRRQEKAIKDGRRNSVLKTLAELSDGALSFETISVVLPAWASRRLAEKAQKVLKEAKSQKEWHFGADSDCGADESPFAALKGLFRQPE